MPKRNEQLQKLEHDLLDRNKRRAIIEEQTRRFDSLFIAMDEFPPTPPHWLVQGFIPQGYLCLLAGDPKSGKTALATAIALAIVQGKPFAKRNVQKSPVLWLALEESRRERAAVLFPLIQKNAPPNAEKRGYLDCGPTFPFYTCYEGIAIDTEDGINALRHWLNKTQARLIVVDPLHAAHSGRSLYDGWAARKTLRDLKKLCNDSGVTALVLHHLTTRGKRRVVESVQLSAIAGMVMMLSFRHPAGQSDSRIVTLDCMGRGRFTNTTFHFASANPLDYQPVDPPPNELRTKEKRTLETRYTFDNLVLETLARCPRSTAADLAGELQTNPNTVRNSLARLKAAQKIRVVGWVSGATLYDLPLESHPLTKKNEHESNESSESSTKARTHANPNGHHTPSRTPGASEK